MADLRGRRIEDMSVAIPSWLGPWLVGAGLVGLALALLVAVRAYFQVRRAEFYVVREEARRAGLRAILMVFLLALLTLVAVFFPRQAARPQATPLPTLQTPAQTLTTVPTSAPSTATPTATPTAAPQPTATEPFIPTSTPPATLPPEFASPLPSAVPPPGDARLEFWTFSQEVSENSQPVRPGTQFEAGIERVYLFFRYDGLLPNASWAAVWYKDGQLLSGGAYLWESQRPTGEWYVYLTLEDGYPAGEYEVQVWLGSRLQIRARFSVVTGGG